jgi:hypothetical protein
MSFLDIDASVTQEVERDSVGGFQPFETDLYEMVIKTAFLDKSAGGANNVTILFETPEGKTFKLVEYITSKAGNNFYIDKKDGKTKRPLPGMSKMNGLSNLVKGTDLGKQVLEDKVHKIWDATQSKEVPQTRKTFTEWSDQTVHIGLQKIVENKQVKSGDKYVPTAETREVNVVAKFFDKDKATISEVADGKPAAFYKDWLKVNEGVTKDKTDKSLKSGAPSVSGGASTEPLKFD